MNMLLSFESPLEFLLRYTVLAGIVVAIVGVVIYALAKRITQAKRHTDEIDPKDKLCVTLRVIGICLILLAFILIALPIENTFYVLPTI